MDSVLMSDCLSSIGQRDGRFHDDLRQLRLHFLVQNGQHFPKQVALLAVFEVAQEPCGDVGAFGYVVSHKQIGSA